MLRLRHVLIQVQDVAYGTKGRCPVRLAPGLFGCCVEAAADVDQITSHRAPEGQCSEHRFARIHHGEVVAPRLLGSVRIGEGIEAPERPIGILLDLGIHEKKSLDIERRIAIRVVEMIERPLQPWGNVLRCGRILAWIVVFANCAEYEPREYWGVERLYPKPG